MDFQKKQVDFLCSFTPETFLRQLEGFEQKEHNRALGLSYRIVHSQKKHIIHHKEADALYYAAGVILSHEPAFLVKHLQQVRLHHPKEIPKEKAAALLRQGDIDHLVKRYGIPGDDLISILKDRAMFKSFVVLYETLLKAQWLNAEFVAKVKQNRLVEIVGKFIAKDTRKGKNLYHFLRGWYEGSTPVLPQHNKQLYFIARDLGLCSSLVEPEHVDKVFSDWFIKEAIPQSAMAFSTTSINYWHMECYVRLRVYMALASRPHVRDAVLTRNRHLINARFQRFGIFLSNDEQQELLGLLDGGVRAPGSLRDHERAHFKEKVIYD